MSKENNKIKVDDLLKAAKVKNLKKYFKDLNAEVSIKEFLYSILGISRQPDSKPDSEEVFTLIFCIWKNYKDEEGGLQLGSNEIY